MGFLIKFCSASSYRRLVKLSNNKLQPGTSIDSHFDKKKKITNN